MRRLSIVFFLFVSWHVAAQYRMRPDALPSDDSKPAKGVVMAATLGEMYAWQAYPTYEVYLQMMQDFARRYPALCHIDTIGRSVQNRLLLALVIDGGNAAGKREMLYAGAIHGNELASYYLLLRLCDTLLGSYDVDDDITHLLDNISVYINPLMNPDGTYRGGNASVGGAVRYNANYVDLNRNYPDPFGAGLLDDLQVENKYQIDYIKNHHFVLSATLHGGAEVLNYPWDSFTSASRKNEHDQWWRQVCSRFVERGRENNPDFFTNITESGYIVGGDWYVIRNGRQDYMNYNHGIRELTMEVSATKMLTAAQLDSSWHAIAPSLIGYIAEALDIEPLSVHEAAPNVMQSVVYPNPTSGRVYVKTPNAIHTFNLSNRPAGIYFINAEGVEYKVIKQ